MIYQASMEDFIYVLLGIAWVLFSIYNAKKKKERKIANSKTSEKQNIKPKPSFIDSLVEEMGIKENLISPYDEKGQNEIAGEVVQSEPKIFSYDDYYEEGNFENNKPVLIKEADNTNKGRSEFLSDKKTKITRERIKTVDLRKAVLYSEILNKKYF